MNGALQDRWICMKTAAPKRITKNDHMFVGGCIFLAGECSSQFGSDVKSGEKSPGDERAFQGDRVARSGEIEITALESAQETIGLCLLLQRVKVNGTPGKLFKATDIHAWRRDVPRNNER